MPSWQGRSKGSPFGYRIFVAVLKNFGVLPAYFLLRFVAFYYFLFSFSSSRTSFDFFHGKLKFGRFRSITKIYKNYYLFGQSIIDKVVVMSGIPGKFTFHFDGEQNLRDIAAQGKGGLLLSAHVGNWEVAGHLLKRIGIRIHVVMFDGEHERIKQYISGITGERNVNVIVIRNDLSHIYEISEALRNNELVCMHADRFLKGNKTMSTTFLNHPAEFPMGPFVLAAQFKVPVTYVFAMKEGPLHYHLFSSQPRVFPNSDKKDMMKVMLDDYVEEIEAKIKKYPEQWYNYYKFWLN